MSTIPTGTYVIDPAHSEVSFTVRHAGIAKVRGVFDTFSGSIDVGADLASSSATATIDASSIDTGDATRDNHLRSGDFFDVATRPTWTFEGNRLERAGDDLTLLGDLTINGVTKQVALDVEYNGAAVDPFGNARVGFSASTELSRKEFGLTWNVALEAGGFLVGDKAKVNIEVSAIKQA